MQQKVTRAAALTSQATGLSIAIHTAAAVAAMEVLDIVKAVGVEPDRWIFVHAQHEPNTDLLVAVARRGGMDLPRRHRTQHGGCALYSAAQAVGRRVRAPVLLSHVAGWYRVVEEPGGAKDPITYLLGEFIPLMKRSSVSEETVHIATVTNPSVAFEVR